MKNNDQHLRFRLAIIFVGFAAFIAVVVGRLVQLQILTYPELRSLAHRQYQMTAKQSHYRLPILDRNGRALAVSIPATSVYVRPRLVKHSSRVARNLQKLLGNSTSHWRKKLRSKRAFVWIERQIDEPTAIKLRALKLQGIFFQIEHKRIYPNGQLAAQILGFTNIDGRGISGMELALEKQLSPVDSKFRLSLDGRGTPSYYPNDALMKSVSEEGVRLSLDIRIQHLLEEELEKAAEINKAKAALGVVMDPNTGEILAMGQTPTGNPNLASKQDAGLFTNRVVSHRYEPGSTLKVLFAAEAIQRGILQSESSIRCENGKVKVGNITISEADMKHRFQTLPLKQVIQYSSNVGAVKVAQTLGSDKVRETLEKFGLQGKTDVALPGEVSSAARDDKYWTPVHLATVGFGQGISVTPLQIVSAYTPFTNGGYWVRPRIMFLEDKKAQLNVRRVLSASVAQQMKNMLVSVVDGKGGTGENARIAGFNVAGKTGTAQKYIRGEGYNSGKYFSSFIGFAPAERPRVLVGIMLDEPKTAYYGGQVAAPAFSSVTERSLKTLGVMPVQRYLSVKPVAKMSSNQSIPKLEEPSEGKFEMPDLSGLSMRQTLLVLGGSFKDLRLSGAGFVAQQSPKPGTPITSTSHLRLIFDSPKGS